MNLPFQPPLAPMEARHVDALPSGARWQYEPKWDGFRAICFRDGNDVYISSRKELPFNRYFPEIVAAAKSLPERRFVLDGEIVVFTADGKGLDFDALLQRIHPAASRVARPRSSLSTSWPGRAGICAGSRWRIDAQSSRRSPTASRRPSI